MIAYKLTIAASAKKELKGFAFGCDAAGVGQNTGVAARAEARKL